MRTSATAAWPASRRARPARLTTGAPCRAPRRTASSSSLAGTRCPTTSRPSNLPRKAWRRMQNRFSNPRRCHCLRLSPATTYSTAPNTAPPCRRGRRRTPIPTSTAPSPPLAPSRPPWSAMRASPRSGVTTIRTISCWTSAPRRSRCWKASPSASCRPAWMPAGARTMRASIRSPVRAMASGPATTISR